MKWNRWLRDIVILVISAVICYGCYLWFSKPANGQTIETDLQSAERQVADLALQRRTWNVAAENFEKIVAQDPDNGYAWYFLGLSRWNASRPLIDARNQELAAPNPNTERLQSIQSELQSIVVLSRAALNEALLSARYRNSARYLLAVIHCNQDEVEQAVQLLHAALDDGYVRRGGVESADVAAIASHPDFEVLKQKEYKNLRAASYLMPVLPPRSRRR